MKVGFIGIGMQGGGMAQMIAKSGHELTVWARRPEVLPPFVAVGARVADTPAAVAANVDVMCLCVVSDADVNEIVYDKGVLDAMPRGSILAIHSTVDVATCQAISQKAAPRGISVIDAPVSGSGEAALMRKLIVMVGGEAEAIERARPVFETYSDCVIFLGPVGSGQRAKIVNNLLFYGNVELAGEALALGRKLGIDPAGLKRCLSNASARSYAMDNVERILVPQAAEHLSRLTGKDVKLAIDAAHAAGAELGMLEAAAKGLLDSFERLKKTLK